MSKNEKLDRKRLLTGLRDIEKAPTRKLINFKALLKVLQGKKVVEMNKNIFKSFQR